MNFFDTHAHLDLLAYRTKQNYEQIINDSFNNNVKKILIPSTSIQNIETIISLTKQYSNQIFSAIGLHPYFVEHHQLNDLISLEYYIKNNKKVITAIGEIGLDKRIDISLWQTQNELFIRQLEFAKWYDLPVIIHSVKTHNEVYRYLKEFALTKAGIIHAFSGSYQQAKSFIDLGYKIGVGGSITYPRANKTRETIANLPLHSLVLETDSPDMPICGKQGSPNHPIYIKNIFQTLCELRKEEPAQIQEQIWKNSNEIIYID